MSTPVADGLVAPAYGDRSIADLVPAVAHALGAGSALGPAPTGLRLPPAPAYVVLLVDGLGSTLLERHRRSAPFLASLAQGPDAVVGTAGIPSTTATSLTSLGTGLAPGQHGVVGFTARVPGTDSLLNHLQWNADIDPRQWQPHPTVFDRLRREVAVTVVNKRAFAGSGLTTAAHRGADYIGVDTVGERIATAVALAAPGGGPSLTYLYESDLDHVGHRYGVDSGAWRQQLALIDGQVEQLREELPHAARLVVCADHGMVDSPPGARVDIDGSGDGSDDVGGGDSGGDSGGGVDLRDGLLLVGGEARLRHLYCRRGAVDDVATRWRAALGDGAIVLTRDEAIARGWFGDVAPGVRARLGDVIVAALGDLAILASADFPYEKQMVGMHGSLTADEMLVPFLLA